MRAMARSAESRLRTVLRFCVWFITVLLPFKGFSVRHPVPTTGGVSSTGARGSRSRYSTDGATIGPSPPLSAIPCRRAFAGRRGGPCTRLLVALPASRVTVATMRVLLVGDVHGNHGWWERFVLPAAERERADLICQLGDFGYWPRRSDFTERVAAGPLPVLFLDGNHEDHETLRHHREVVKARNFLNPAAPVPLGGSLYYLPRGARLLWEGVRIAVLGGAHSIDRALRTAGVDWFPEESITRSDLDLLAAGGPADILLTHDAPHSATPPLVEAPVPHAWRSELASCAAHRTLVEEGLEAVRPSLLVHGHYHVAWSQLSERAWGDLRVLGLTHDGTGVSNLALLECHAGEFRLSTPAA